MLVTKQNRNRIAGLGIALLAGAAFSPGVLAMPSGEHDELQDSRVGYAVGELPRATDEQITQDNERLVDGRVGRVFVSADS